MLIMAPSLLMVRGKEKASFNMTAGANGADEGFSTADSVVFGVSFGSINSGDTQFNGEDIRAVAWDDSSGATLLELSGGGDGFVSTVSIDGTEYSVTFLQPGAWRIAFSQLVFDTNSYDIVITE